MLAIGLLGGLLISTGTVKADQLIFSQYDGVNTWNNIYVEVEDASIYEGAFIDGVPGSSWGSVVAVAGVEGKAAVTKTTTVTTPTTRLYKNHKVNKKTGKITRWTVTYEKLGTNRWLRVGNGKIQTFKKMDKRGGNKSLVKITQATSTTTTEVIEEAVEEVEAVAGRQGGHEDPQVRRTIVSVPTGIDMQEFIKDYMS